MNPDGFLNLISFILLQTEIGTMTVSDATAGQVLCGSVGSDVDFVSVKKVSMVVCECFY